MLQLSPENGRQNDLRTALPAFQALHALWRFDTQDIEAGFQLIQHCLTQTESRCAQHRVFLSSDGMGRIECRKRLRQIIDMLTQEVRHALGERLVQRGVEAIEIAEARFDRREK